MSKKATTKKETGKPKKGFLQRERSKFTFPNGDSYDGEYGIILEERNIFRHGIGTYTKSNGQRLTGKWIDDKLMGPVEITFRNSSKFMGSMSALPEYTVGKFIFPDESQLTGDFKNNFDVDERDVTFYDPNGKEWNHQLTNDEKMLILRYNWTKQEHDHTGGALDTCDSDNNLSEEVEIE